MGPSSPPLTYEEAMRQSHADPDLYRVAIRRTIVWPTSSPSRARRYENAIPAGYESDSDIDNAYLAQWL